MASDKDEEDYRKDFTRLGASSADASKFASQLCDSEKQRTQPFQEIVSGRNSSSGQKGDEET